MVGVGADDVLSHHDAIGGDQVEAMSGVGRNGVAGEAHIADAAELNAVLGIATARVAGLVGADPVADDAQGRAGSADRHNP